MYEHRVVLEVARAAYQTPFHAMSRALKEDSVEPESKQYTSAVACFVMDFGAVDSCPTLPPTHRKSVRTTNLSKRLFRDDRRCVDEAGSMFCERLVPKMMDVARIQVTEKWRGVKISGHEKHRSERLREQLRRKHRDEVRPAGEPASGRARISISEGM